MKRVLLINQSFPPDRGASGQLLGDLFARLCREGFDVTVVSAPPTYAAQKVDWLASETTSRMRVFRVGTDRFRGRKSMFTRLAGYLSYLWSTFWRVRSLIAAESFDLVTTASNPPIVGLLGVWAAARSGAPFVYMLHDLHPDSFIAASGRDLPIAAKWLWDTANSRIFSGASKIIVVGEGLRDCLREKGVPLAKIEVIHQWAHPELDAPEKVDCNALDRSVSVLYFGNMGLGQSLDWLVTAALRLRDTGATFRFMGDGPERQRLQSLAKQNGLSNVSFLPYCTGEEFGRAVATADVCVVALKPGLEKLAVPSKTYTILSAGKPLLALISKRSDVAEIVRCCHCGWVAESPSEVESIVRAILLDGSQLGWYGKNARSAYVKEFSLDSAVASYRRLFLEACQDAARKKGWH